MVRSDRSARGGTAARLLAAEKELSCITASAAEARGAPIHQLDWAQRHPSIIHQSLNTACATHKPIVAQSIIRKQSYLMPALTRRLAE